MIRQILTDPVLRRWVVASLCRGQLPHRQIPRAWPPYLAPYRGSSLQSAKLPNDFSNLPATPPASAITLPLAGETLHLEPNLEGNPFSREFSDLEVYLSLHRFAWLPRLGPAVDPRWINRLWRLWCDESGTPENSWSWHPYTTAERAINILRYGLQTGLPTPRTKTTELLVEHAHAILGHLEYFGESATGNHLANNGRGLYFIGVVLDIERFADIGIQILLNEAKRIFTPSGILREGSSHYHLLLTHNYQTVRELAERYGRPDAAELSKIVMRARKFLPAAMLPGGFPLIGDISPDATPADLIDISGDLFKGNASLDADGWLRAGRFEWQGLWHAAPEGWPETPGHAHHDCGGFEIHYGNEPIFIDLGRGRYGEAGEAAHYRSAKTHNTLMVDDTEPYPPGKPYYDPAFRRRIGGPPPQLVRNAEGVKLAFDGFCRLGDVGTVTRRWAFAKQDMILIDEIAGSGRHRISRYLHTELNATAGKGGVMLRGQGSQLQIACDGQISLNPATRWTAYGEGRPATSICIEQDVTLPWTSQIKVVVQ